MAYTYMYKNGLLAYVSDPSKLRFISLQGNVSDETVVDVRKLLDLKIPHFESCAEYQLRPVHYAHGIISCLFSRTGVDVGEGWLIFWAIESPNDSLRVIPLEEIHRLFVRNNSSHLYYGVTDLVDDDLGSDMWRLRGLDLKTGDKIAGSIPLSDFLGTTIGTDACFEVIDDFLYGVSSVATEDESAEPNAAENSFYYGFRFRMGHHSSFEELPLCRSWRRHKQDGPLDERWSTLELVQDEATGIPTLYETRKEWNVHRPYSQRFCYRKELDFTPEPDDILLDATNSLLGVISTQTSAMDPSNEVHAGDSGSSYDTPIFTDTLGRWYSPSARCFVDLVKRSREGAEGRQFFNLRVRPQQTSHLRRLSSPSPRLQGLRGEGVPGQCDVFEWPPSSVSACPAGDSTKELMDALELGGSTTDTSCMSADERCLVFSHVFNRRVQPLPPVRVLCFDPGVRFYGHRNLAEKAPSPDRPQSAEVAVSRLNTDSADWLYKTQAHYGWIRGLSGGQMGFDLG